MNICPYVFTFNQISAVIISVIVILNYLSEYVPGGRLVMCIDVTGTDAAQLRLWLLVCWPMHTCNGEIYILY